MNPALSDEGIFLRVELSNTCLRAFNGFSFKDHQKEMFDGVFKETTQIPFNGVFFSCSVNKTKKNRNK